MQDNIHTSVEEQLAMFLHVVGHNQRFRVIHSTFRRSCETISRYFKKVLFTIGELRPEMIKVPLPHTPTKLTNSFRWFLICPFCITVLYHNLLLFMIYFTLRCITYVILSYFAGLMIIGDLTLGARF